MGFKHTFSTWFHKKRQITQGISIDNDIHAHAKSMNCEKYKLDKFNHILVNTII